MPRKPKRPSRGDRPAAERQLASAAPVRQFVDREEFVAPVHAALKEPPRTKPLVLVYYGGAGIGKSRLRRELTKQMAADPGVLTATLDFGIPIYRQPDAALFFLRNSIREAYQVRFPSFDLAYAVYWQKTHPDTALRSEEGGERREEAQDQNDERWTLNDERGMLEPGSLLSQLPDETGKLPLIGLIPRITKLFAASLDPLNPRPLDPFLRAWWEKRGERELEDLPQMEPAAIVECLPKLWASDLKDCLGAAGLKPQATSKEPVKNRESEFHHQDTKAQVQNDAPSDGGRLGQRSTMNEERGTRRAVLFIDAYEQLWGTVDGGQETVDNRQKTDEWVRELVTQLPEVLWVICGRQKLRWEEVETDWGNALSQHQLGALPDKSARRFLESCGITNEPIQDAIVKGSQGVPHYLDLAVDTIQSSEFGVRSSELQGDSPAELVKQFVRHLDQPEIETLQVLSGPRFWYYGLFENLMTEYQTGYPLTAYDDLSRFSFVTEGAAPGTRTMHELMREALQESQSPELRKRVHLFLHELYAKQLEGLEVKGITEKHRAALNEAFYHGRQAKSAEDLWAWFTVASDVFDKAGQYRLLIPLVREIVQALETELGPNHPSVAESLFRLAKEFTEQGDHDEAEPLFRRALAIFERELGPEHELVCDCLVWLSRLLRERARYDEAEVLGRRAVGVSDKPDKPATLRCSALGNLAEVLADEQKFTEAEEFCRRALAISEKELGPGHRHTADKLNTLAELLYKLGRYAEAEPLFRRALAIFEKNLGANHPIVANPLTVLGQTLSALGRFTEAELLLRRAVRLSEESLGPDNPRTAVRMSALCVLLTEQGRYAEAEPLLRRALGVREKSLGPDHPDTVDGAIVLIGVLMEQHKYADAEPLILSAIATGEKKLGTDHFHTATALHWAGILYTDTEQGRYAEAEGYLRRALEIKTRLLGPEHPHTFGTLDSLGVLEERRGRYAEAESLYREVLKKRERVQGPDHPNVAVTTSRVADMCCRDGRYAEAEALYRRALAIREKACGPDHPRIANGLMGLAEVCEQTGRTSEAEALYRRALAIREKVFGPDHTRVAETLEGLAKVCEQTDRTAEAQELAERAQRIRAQAEPAPSAPQQQA